MDIKLKKAIENYKQNIKEFKETGFSKHQINEIKEGIEQGLDDVSINKYAKPEFNWLQMVQIKAGLCLDLNVDKYADPKFNDSQMAQIRYGLEKGIDVTKYADPKFNWKQMLIIREGLEQGLNVSAYANPDINWTKMEQIKEKSKQRINWHKITRRIPTEEEKEVYNYKNNDVMLEGLPNYDIEVPNFNSLAESGAGGATE